MNQSDRSQFIKSFDWLETHLNNPELSIVDASWFLPAQNRNGKAEYDNAHIPGAVFFDQDAIVNAASPLPHALPTPDGFAKAVGALGISNEHTIIVYDALGLFTAPRVWWMFKIMGAQRVYVLDGGFDQWKIEGRPVTNVPSEPNATSFDAILNQGKTASLEMVMEALKNEAIQILDARSAGRFTGQEAEPRPGMRSGHMPGAINIPFQTLSENGQLKPLAELKSIFAHHHVDLSEPIITSCGSGVTAAVIILALQSIGHHNNMLYDGSWSEWGARADTPIVTATTSVKDG